jgi:hypothetical protein
VEAMMSVELITINFRNILAFQLLMALAFAGNEPVVQQELLKIWKRLNTPLLPKKSAGTNHKSNKFWEIDMTKFEP